MLRSEALLPTANKDKLPLVKGVVTLPKNRVSSKDYTEICLCFKRFWYTHTYDESGSRKWLRLRHWDEIVIFYKLVYDLLFNKNGVN